MPTLDLDHHEPFAATLGIMLYPGTDNEDRENARAFASHWIQGCLKNFHEAGHRLPAERMARLLEDGGVFLTDGKARLKSGQAVGDIFKALFLLAKDHPSLASWEHAISIYETGAARAKKPGSRSALWREIKRFKSVAHLWGAWSIRDYRDFAGSAELGYDGYDDFQCFLAQAELLRDFGQSWRHRRAKSGPPLPAEVWRIPVDWNSQNRRPSWPNPDDVLTISFPDNLVADLKPSGRPRKAG